MYPYRSHPVLFPYMQWCTETPDGDTIALAYRRGGKARMVTKAVDGRWVEMLEGVERQNLVHGENTHLIKFRLRGGSTIPMHDHPHEQTGYLLAGRMIMSIEGEEQLLETGDSWSLKGGVSHGVHVIEECLVLEVFSPVREEYFD
jgi:quercetin dioxygenase-like cupin family protein